MNSGRKNSVEHIFVICVCFENVKSHYFRQLHYVILKSGLGSVNINPLTQKHIHIHQHVQDVPVTSDTV